MGTTRRLPMPTPSLEPTRPSSLEPRYNNVFNPIGSEGTSGATKELIRSYYEDPTNELTAVRKSLVELQKLAE